MSGPNIIVRLIDVDAELRRCVTPVDAGSSATRHLRYNRVVRGVRLFEPWWRQPIPHLESM